MDVYPLPRIEDVLDRLGGCNQLLPAWLNLCEHTHTQHRDQRVRNGHTANLDASDHLGTCSNLEKFPQGTVLVDAIPTDWVTTSGILQREGKRMIDSEKIMRWGATTRGVREASGTYVDPQELASQLSAYPTQGNQFTTINGTLTGEVQCQLPYEHTSSMGGGCQTLNGNEIAAYRVVALELHCWPADTVVTVGKSPIMVRTLGNPTMGNIRKQYTHVTNLIKGFGQTAALQGGMLQVARSLCKATLEAAGINGWWEKLGLWALLGLLVAKSQNTTTVLALVIRGFLIATAEASCHGCALDPVRKMISCGPGEFVWKELPGWWNKFTFSVTGDDPVVKVYASLGKAEVNCLACFNHLECAYLLEFSDDFAAVDQTLLDRKHVVVLNDEPTPHFCTAFEAAIPEASKVPHRRAKRGVLEHAIRWVNDKKRETEIIETAVMVTSTGDIELTDETCQKVHLFAFDVVGFSVGFIRTVALVEVYQAKSTPITCPETLMSHAGKGKRAVHRDQSLWVESEKEEEGQWGIVEISMHEYRECMLPVVQTTQYWKEPRFMPAVIGGPPTAGFWLHHATPGSLAHGSSAGLEEELP
ncbi:hypothetical protein OUZ56_019095 [Daphnia magna]|uniref:Non-structural protein NS1 flavivirus domain-containing protein n=1 Tax=Daphnia magna TaxID=35525 RepID=A0ABQ9ZAM2_9CRUS|nr:hypothetical protein OUZ56_019095 [Daphnia magna]